MNPFASLGGGGLSASNTDSSSTDVSGRSESTFGNVFSAPFAVGRGSKAEGTATATQPRSEGSDPTNLIVGIGAAALVGVILWKLL